MNAPNPGALARTPTLPIGPFGSKPPPCWLTAKPVSTQAAQTGSSSGSKKNRPSRVRPGQPDPAETLLLGPVDLLDGLIDIVEGGRQLTPSPLGRLRAEVDQPAVVDLPAGFAELGVGGVGEVIESIHLEGPAVGEEHLTDHADGLEHLDAKIRVPLHLGVELGMQVPGIAEPGFLGLPHLLVVGLEVLLRHVVAIRPA